MYYPSPSISRQNVPLYEKLDWHFPSNMGIEENKHSDGGEVKQICQKSMLLGYYAVKKVTRLWKQFRGKFCEINYIL